MGDRASGRADDRGRLYVDLNNPDELERFILQRRSPPARLPSAQVMGRPGSDVRTSRHHLVGGPGKPQELASRLGRPRRSRQQLAAANLELPEDDVRTTMRDEPACDHA